MSAKDFTIAKVAWIIERPGNTVPIERVIKTFFSVAKFLQDNGLSRGVLASRPEDIGPEFTIESSDLTERGLQVMRAAFDKWLRRVDKGMDPDDISMLKKALRSK